MFALSLTELLIPEVVWLCFVLDYTSVECEKRKSQDKLIISRNLVYIFKGHYKQDEKEGEKKNKEGEVKSAAYFREKVKLIR